MMPYEAIEYFEENELQPDNTAQRSELAQEIISQKPGFLEQWALLIFIAILLLVFTAAWLIQYPDTIEANATLMAVNTPEEIVPGQEGRLVKLFVQNNEMVSRNEVFAWIESTASHEEILKLSAQTDSSIDLCNNGQPEKVAQLFTKNFTNLGEIQQSYQTFLTALQNDSDPVVNVSNIKRKTTLNSNLQSSQNTGETIHNQQHKPQMFQQALQSLKSEVDAWKKKYVLQASVSGRLSFIIPLQENQFLQTGKIIGYILPADSHVYVQAYLPQMNLGKVDTGQQVQLRFDAYPYQEFGAVKGTVTYISGVASDSGFLATIRLNKGLLTNNGNSLSYKTGLTAQAIIITKNRRLLSRLWYNAKKSVFVDNKKMK